MYKLIMVNALMFKQSMHMDFLGMSTENLDKALVSSSPVFHFLEVKAILHLELFFFLEDVSTQKKHNIDCIELGGVPICLQVALNSLFPGLCGDG
jgi:hypothetical protein